MMNSLKRSWLLFIIVAIVALMPTVCEAYAENDTTIKDDVTIVEPIEIDSLEVNRITEKKRIQSTEKTALAAKCNSNYGYNDIVNNMKSEEKKALYEAIDEVELAFFNSDMDLSDDNNYLTVGYDSSLTVDDIVQVYSLYCNDHPLYYWMVGTIGISNDSLALYCDDSFFKASERDTAYSKIVTAIEEYEGYCKGGTSYYTFATAVVYLMAQKIDYAYNNSGEPETALWAHTIIGVFDEQYHEAVCEGYAKAYQLLMNYLGVPNVYVVGDASGNTGDSSETVLHAWNLVQMEDGAYYWADPTWTDVDLRKNLYGEEITETEHVLNYNLMENHPYRVRYTYHLKGNDFTQNHNPMSSSDTGAKYLYDLPEVSETQYEPSIQGELPVNDLLMSANWGYSPGEVINVDTGDLTTNYSFIVVQNDGIHREVEIKGFGRCKTELNIPAEISYNDVIYQVAGVNLGAVEYDMETVILAEGIRYIHQLMNYDKQVTRDVYLPSTIEFISHPEISQISIENIYVDDDNPYISDENGILFNKNKTVLIRYPMNKKGKAYVIPSTVSRINAGAFLNCKYLENLQIPSSVTAIGEKAFQGMNSISELSIPESVAALPDYIALESTVKKISISKNTRITANTFTSVYGLEEIDIEDGNPYAYTYDGALYINGDRDQLATYPAGRKAEMVTVKDDTEISDYAFTDATFVGKVVIPEHVIVKQQSFYRSGVESIELDTNNNSCRYENGALISADKTELWTYLAGCKNETFEVPESVTKICIEAFTSNHFLIEIGMTNNVRSIEARAFFDCISLMTVRLSNRTVLGQQAFCHCTSLESIEIPEGITYLPKQLFSECFSLNSIVIPLSVKTMERGAFECTDDRALTDIYYYGSKEDWNAIDNSITALDNIIIHYNYDGSEITNYADDFEWSVSDDVLTLSGNGRMRTYGIERRPWNNKKDVIKTVIVNEGLTSISRWAFADCTNLENVVLPDTLKSIDKSAFVSCTSLEDIALPNGLESIGMSAFNGAGLTNLSIGSTVNNIGSSTFYGCKHLENISVDQDSDCYFSKDGVLFDKRSNMLVIYPNAKQNKVYEIPEDTVGVSEYAFWECDCLGSVIMPESIKKIDYYAFNNCRGLRTIAFLGNAPKIDPFGFFGLNTTTIFYDQSKSGWEEVIGQHYEAYIIWSPYQSDKMDTDHHLWDEGRTTQFVTCTDQGITTYDCLICGDTKEEYTKALGHDYKEIEGSSIAATCTADGKESNKQCSRCGDFLEGDVINKLPHDLTKHNKVEAKCETAGTEAYWECENCHNLFSDKDGEHGLESPEVIPALEHNYEEVEGSAVAATCETDGKKADKECSLCHDVIVGEKINAIGHDWGDWQEAEQSTCVSAGQRVRICKNNSEHKEYENTGLANHDLTRTEAKNAKCMEAGNIEYWKCNVCKKYFSDNGQTEITQADTLIDPLGHDYQVVAESAKEATCTEAGNEADRKCSRCNSVIEGAVINKLPHDLTKRDKVEAKCETAGSEAYWECDSCHTLFSDKDGEHEIESPEVIPALKHNYEEVEGSAKTASCTEAGKEADKKCSRCDSVIEGAVINKLPHYLTRHDKVDAKCEKAGTEAYWECENCHELFSDKAGEHRIESPGVIPALKHNYEEVEESAKAATCTVAGKEADKKCSKCGSVIEGKVIPALSHDWGEWEEATPSTCIREGQMKRVCRRDPEHVEYKDIDLIDHKLTHVEAKEQTCTAAGNIEYWTCSVCGNFFLAEGKTKITQADTVIPATGHDYKTVDRTGKSATCTEEGKEADQKCSVCGDVKTGNRIAKLSHTLEHVALKKATAKAVGNIDHWTCRICGTCFSDAECKTLIAKEDTVIPVNSFKVTIKKKTYAAKTKTQTTLKTKNLYNVKNKKGAVTYKKANKVGKSKITVAKNGNITVKKGLKKGTYKVKVKVTSAATAKYTACARTVTVNIKIK